MKRIALCFATIALLASCISTADASDFSKFLRQAFGTEPHAHHHNARYQAQYAHAQHLAELEQRAAERQFVHRAAHQQPLTNGQHGRLHTQLDRAAQYDELEHRSAHATRAYSPSYLRQTYQSAPYGYGSPYGASQYRPYRLEGRIGCSPYDRY